MKPTIMLLAIAVTACMHSEVEPTVSLERLRVQAEQYHKSHQFDNAIELYEELARAMPLTVQDCYRLGQAYYYTEQYQKADLTFAKLQAKFPNSQVALLWRARSNASIDSMTVNGLALPYFKKLVEDPNNKSQIKLDYHEAYLYLCHYYLQKNDYRQVKVYLTKLIELYSSDDPAVDALKSTLKTIEQNEQMK